MSTLGAGCDSDVKWLSSRREQDAGAVELEAHLCQLLLGGRDRVGRHLEPSPVGDKAVTGSGGPAPSCRHLWARPLTTPCAAWDALERRVYEYAWTSATCIEEVGVLVLVTVCQKRAFAEATES